LCPSRVLEGIKIGSPGGNNTMPPFSDAYSDEEIAAVSNYVIGHFGGKQGKVMAAEVRRLSVNAHHKRPVLAQSGHSIKRRVN
jgi:mono/diheme cytochrome c family protein